MVNAQKWLDANYPKEIRSEIKNLYIREKELEGLLDLSDFVNLEELDCSKNWLTGLCLVRNTNLTYFDCRDNQLVDFDFSSLNPKKIIRIYVVNNNLSPRDLSCFKNFVNLERLDIGNWDEKKINQDIYNRWVGSLKPLENLTMLESLYISNTDINSGVDYLPTSTKRIHYSTAQRLGSKIKEIEEELNIFLGKRISKNWKDIHHSLDKEKQREWENLFFNYEQTKEWIEVGLKPDDYYFAAWLRLEGYSPQQDLNLEELRKKSRNAQEWLNREYPHDKRKWVNWIDINRSGFEGSLVIEDFPNLERIDCWQNQISSLKLNNLPKLTYLSARDNELTKLVVNNCSEINWLDVQNNFLTDLEFVKSLSPDRLGYLNVANNKLSGQHINKFSDFRNLKCLYLGGNGFYGNLESLKNLTKLEELNFLDTEIDSGLEYLPSSLREVTLVPQVPILQNSNSLKLIGRTNPLRKGKGFVDNPYYDFKYWKEAQPYFQWLKEELEKINPNLDVYDILGNIFFNVRTGDFEGNLQSIISLLQINKAFLDEREREINLLELRVRELNSLIEEQKKKMHNAYLYCISEPEEKELLDQLIKKYVEFTKFKKQGFESAYYDERCDNYNEQCQEIKKKLRSRLDKQRVKEIMNKVSRILNDCEEIVNWQLELETKFNSELLLLEEKKQTTNSDISTSMESLSQRLQSRIEQQQLAEFVKEKLSEKIRGIEKIEVFPTWFNDKCAIVINKEKNYNLWIVTYESAFGKTEERINCLKVAKLPPIKEKWEEITKHFKKSLNSDYPAAETHNNIYTLKLPPLVQNYANVREKKIKISLQDNPDDYLKPHDIVKVGRRGGLYQHVAIYLGDKKVVHVNNPEGKRSSQARFSKWEEFLKGRKKAFKDKFEIEICHPFIPFKKQELIQEHVNIAVEAEYGKKKYHFLKDNCEHFATMCVYGLGMSEQSNKVNNATKDSDYLLQAMRESNKFFKELKKSIQDQSNNLKIISVIETSPKK